MTMLSQGHAHAEKILSFKKIEIHKTPASRQQKQDEEKALHDPQRDDSRRRRFDVWFATETIAT
jgi:hypothetical protein